MLPDSSPSPAAVGITLNSWTFLFLASVAVVLLRLVRRSPLRAAILLVFNICFLATYLGDLPSICVLIGLIGLTYVLAEARFRAPQAFPVWLIVLVVFIYWAFLFLVKDPALGGRLNPFFYYPVRIVGVSYTVFRCLQYFLDAELHERRNPLLLVNFAIFFPTLLAGPIERFERFQQFSEGTDLDLTESPLPALHRIVNGLFKKYVLADALMPLGLWEMTGDQTWPTPALWLGILVLPLTLYLDFSGYSDVVIGLVRLMGFKLQENFDRPWLARNIQDFWNRWHISLTHFIRDYFFNPLQHHVAYHAAPRWHFPLVLGIYVLTMMLIALWHGVTWGFVVFGLLHSAALVGVQLARRYVFRRLGSRTKAMLLESTIALIVIRILLYGFISLTMLFWVAGAVRGWTILGQLFGVRHG